MVALANWDAGGDDVLRVLDHPLVARRGTRAAHVVPPALESPFLPLGALVRERLRAIRGPDRLL